MRLPGSVGAGKELTDLQVIGFVFPDLSKIQKKRRSRRLVRDIFEVHVPHWGQSQSYNIFLLYKQ